MTTDVNIMIQTGSATETEAVGERIGRRLRGGEMIELLSDLGGGKTTFVRGLVRGTGSSDHVASPTFTVGKVYDTPQLHIHHFDYYRVSEAGGSVGLELAELLEDPSNVVVAEWPAAVHDALPAERITITLARQRTGEDDRQLTIAAAARYAYLFDGEDAA